MWGKIDLNHWKEIPCTSARAATKSDIQKGLAVFAIPSGSQPYDVNLPLCAVHIDDETGVRTRCIAIQIEEASNGIFVGVRYLNGGNGVGTIQEFELYTEPNEAFYDQNRPPHNV
jgi:hypothetical protein